MKKTDVQGLCEYTAHRHDDSPTGWAVYARQAQLIDGKWMVQEEYTPVTVAEGIPQALASRMARCMNAFSLMGDDRIPSPYWMSQYLRFIDLHADARNIISGVPVDPNKSELPSGTHRP